MEYLLLYRNSPIYFSELIPVIGFILYNFILSWVFFTHSSLRVRGGSGPTTKTKENHELSGVVTLEIFYSIKL